MFLRLLAAIAVFVLAYLGLVYLLGPILLLVGIPVVTLIGEFFIKWGLVLAIVIAVWYFATGPGIPWPPSTWVRRQ